VNLSHSVYSEVITRITGLDFFFILLESHYCTLALALVLLASTTLVLVLQTKSANQVNDESLVSRV
jgi:hypothetical protein